MYIYIYIYIYNSALFDVLLCRIRKVYPACVCVWEGGGSRMCMMPCVQCTCFYALCAVCDDTN
jgi:hypothetical protein